jgi:hypothetical protein
MAGSAAQAPQFKTFLCRKQKDEHPRRDFNPTTHDIFVLNSKGVVQIAKSASASQMINVVRRSNDICSGTCDTGVEDDAPLILMYAPWYSELLSSSVYKVLADSKKANHLTELLLLHHLRATGRCYGHSSIVAAMIPIPWPLCLAFDRQIPTAIHLYPRT